MSTPRTLSSYLRRSSCLQHPLSHLRPIQPYLHHPRHFTNTPTPSTPSPPRSSTRPVSSPHKSDLLTRSRGPKSSEETQTDFAALNVLGGTANPSTSIDICIYDGFVLDSGLRIDDGDGVILTSSEAFVWRPWMTTGESTQSGGEGGVIHGNALRTPSPTTPPTSKPTPTALSGGIINTLGQFEIPAQGWGLFAALWPKPDLLIIGTGPTIRPLAPKTKLYLQELGMRLEVLDTRNAASQFNLLATERGVTDIAAAMVPIGFGKP